MGCLDMLSPTVCDSTDGNDSKIVETTMNAVGCKVLWSSERSNGVEHLRHEQSNDQSNASGVDC